jgi:hypothetical protein
LEVFENWVLRRIFGTKGEKLVGGWRILHKEELHNLYASPNIIRVIRSRIMRWAGHVALMEEIRNEHKISVGKLSGKDNSEVRGVDGSDSIKGG